MIIVGKWLGYSVINHLKDILPYAVISVAMCVTDDAEFFYGMFL